MINWKLEHDFKTLAANMGKHFSAYLEFRPEDGKQSSYSEFCPDCQKEVFLFVPTTEKKEEFREELQDALREAPSNLSSHFRHFWFHARCSECGEDLVLMRS